MAEYIATSPQTLTNIGDAVQYTATVESGSCNIHHRANGSAIRVKNTGCCCNPSRYRVSFQGNVTGVAAEIKLAIYQDGELLPSTLMSVVPAAVGDVWTVNADTIVVADCGCSAITVRTLTASVTVNTASIIVNKVA